MSAVNQDVVSERSVYYYISHITWHRADIHSIYRLQVNAWVSNTQDRKEDYNQTPILQQYDRKYNQINRKKKHIYWFRELKWSVQGRKAAHTRGYGVVASGLLLISTSFNKLRKISRLAMFGMRTDEPDASSMHPSL